MKVQKSDADGIWEQITPQKEKEMPLGEVLICAYELSVPLPCVKGEMSTPMWKSLDGLEVACRRVDNGAVAPTPGGRERREHDALKRIRHWVFGEAALANFLLS